jgi:hypothetical protein
MMMIIHTWYGGHTDFCWFYKNSSLQNWFTTVSTPYNGKGSFPKHSWPRS